MIGIISGIGKSPEKNFPKSKIEPENFKTVITQTFRKSCDPTQVHMKDA